MKNGYWTNRYNELKQYELKNGCVVPRPLSYIPEPQPGPEPVNESEQVRQLKEQVNQLTAEFRNFEQRFNEIMDSKRKDKYLY